MIWAWRASTRCPAGGKRARPTWLSLIHISVSFQAPATLSVGGDAYTLAAGQSRNIVHAFADSARRYTLYYNQAGAQPVEPYAITIRYTANDTNQTLYSATVNVPIQHAVYQQVPTEFVYGGNVYTLAAGQSAVIEHQHALRHGKCLLQTVLCEQDGSTQLPVDAPHRLSLIHI